MQEKVNTKIVKLQAENIKRIKAIHIEPSGEMVVIGGQNAQGKTSVLDSIEYALRGGKALPAKPVRNGEKEGYIVLETENLVVKRTFTEAGNSNLTVKDRGNERNMPSPQKLLDDLVGKLSFDPLEFTRMDSKKQKQVTQELANLNFDELDAERKRAFEDRTVVNRDVTRLQSQVQGKEAGVPDELLDTGKLMAELSEKQAIAQGLRDDHQRLTEVNGEMQREKDVLPKLEADVLECKKRIEEYEEEGQRLSDDINATEEPDTQEIESQISNAGAINAKITANKQIEESEKELTTASEYSKELTAVIEGLDKQKADAIASASMPIDGLAFSEDGVTYCDIPFEQCSQAEQLKVSLAMGLSLNPELKIILIRDGSLLDDNSLAIVQAMAEAADAQVFVERVGEGQEVQVIIEDGSIKETR